MNRQLIKRATLVLTLVALLSTVACGGKDNHRRGRRHGPPPEAIAACEDRQAGDSVEFRGRNGEAVQATCREINGRLAAVPAGMSPERDD